MVVHPYRILIISASILAFIFAYMLRITDGSIITVSDLALYYNIDMSKLPNCLWSASVSMTTVGYGDIYPFTNLGRFIIVICAVLGTTIVSLMVISMQNSLNLSGLELRAYEAKRQSDRKKDIQIASARYFMLQYKFYRQKDRYEKLLMSNKRESEISKAKEDLIETLYRKIQKKKDHRDMTTYLD